jgi:hypothetical protein
LPDDFFLIRQICCENPAELVKSARNPHDFRPFFTLRVVFVGFLMRILPYLRSGRGKIFLFFENILHKNTFYQQFY